MAESELHRKYRPTIWDEVLGQDAAVRSIQAALEKQHAHTFLLTGDAGVGKTTIGRLIAQELKCNPFDVMEIDGATNTGIEDMRVVCEHLQYKSLVGSNRVVIVDECHAISAQAWKSLLKITEEPPPGVYWVLCTTEADKVPKAVKTRCLQYNLKLVDEKLLFGLLQRVRDAEGLVTGDKALRLVAEAAGGSPRQALVYLAACGHLKKAESVAPLLAVGVGNSAEAIDLCRALLSCARGSPAALASLTRLIKNIQTPPESIRVIVLRYMASVVLSGDERVATPAATVIKAFSQPFVDREGLAPLAAAVLTVWRSQRR